MIKDHPWIESERQYFGAPGGMFDFATRGGDTAGARLAQLTERREKLARGLNSRAHTLLGKEEEQVLHTTMNYHLKRLLNNNNISSRVSEWKDLLLFGLLYY